MKLNSDQIKKIISEKYGVSEISLKRIKKNSTDENTYRIFSDSVFHYSVKTNKSDSLILSLNKFTPLETTEESPAFKPLGGTMVTLKNRIKSKKIEDFIKVMNDQMISIHLDPSFEDIEGELEEGEELIFCISEEIDYDFGTATTDVSYVIAASTNFMFEREGFGCIYHEDFENPSLIYLELEIDKLSPLEQPMSESSLYHSTEGDFNKIYQEFIKAGFKYSPKLAKDLNANYDEYNDYVLKWKVKP